MVSRRRMTVTISETNFEKLEETAVRYGITTNSFIAFVLGQWVDQNFEEQRLMAGKIDELFSTPEDVLKNPQIMEIVKEILSSDQEFKEAAKNKILNK